MAAASCGQPKAQLSCSLALSLRAAQFQAGPLTGTAFSNHQSKTSSVKKEGPHKEAKKVKRSPVAFKRGVPDQTKTPKLQLLKPQSQTLDIHSPIDLIFLIG